METRKCVQCGKMFTITESEKSFFESRNLNLPKRCKECRDKNKSGKQGYQNPAGNNYKQKTSFETFMPASHQNHKGSGFLSRSMKQKFAISAAVVIFGAIFFAVAGLTSLIDFSSTDKKADDDYYQSEYTTPSTDNQVITAVTTSISESTETASENKTESDVTTENNTTVTEQNVIPAYRFRNSEALSDHFAKHGGEFGYSSAEEYEQHASAVIASPDALHKQEAEDGDNVYYLEATNEIVFVSASGIIRTYFKPDDGIEYFNRQ